MRGRGLLGVLAGVLAVAIVVAGCGSGDGGEAAVASTELSKADFVKKVEAICKKNVQNVKEGYESFVAANGGPDNTFSDPDTAAEFAENVVLKEKKKVIEELESVGAPKGEEEKVRELIEAYEEGIEVGESEPARVTGPTGVFDYASGIAKELGTQGCIA